MVTQQLSRNSILLDRVVTSYLDVGSGDAIVALHGIPTSSLLFSPLLPYLDKYRFVAPDLLGQGRTATPSSGRLDYAAYSDHLRLFMDNVAPQRFDFLLHDFGAVLGLDWASNNPARIKSLTILSTTITGSFRVGRVLYAANLILGRRFLDWGMSFTLKRSEGLDAALREEWAKPWSRRRLLRGTDHFASRNLRRVRNGLPRIQAPVLVIWGEQDDIFPPGQATRLANALPQAKTRTISQCGHWSTWDAPQQVAQYLLEFLEARAES